ncbi:UvrD-helicase domain-containing protein [Georgenia sp. EYE_87]|uniref:HelD family protein n=1 Tax=Georgenia sp. EYE_87 TaxID=2853448 RepID=UPI002004F492|nr:UvrD-helicase domain-containing protein [Georgenia sp. EYE_87]
MTELEHEQEHLDRLYARVDELRAEVAAELTAALRERGASARDLVDREARVDRLTERAVALDHAENGLCFGRLDLTDGQVRYVGRTGLRGPAPERTPLLLDWRAPGARPFYVATPADNHGVLRRRHLRTAGRRVEALEDELLDLDAARGTVRLQGEGALMAALAEHRTGRMKDIVTTLQVEQDEIVRASADGVLVVQGGPGTGKTAVALHRAAYLLYAQPSIGPRGVLVVGPTPTFLDYIEQVLPSLGETQVVLTTPEALVPGVVATRREDPAVERLKGDAVMADVLARAVRARQGSDRDVVVTFEGDEYDLPAHLLQAAADRARRSGRAHNEARRHFRAEVLTALALEVIGAGYRLLQDVEEGLEDELAAVDAALARNPDAVLSRVDAAGSEIDGLAAAHELPLVERDLLADPRVAAVLEGLWPQLTPEGLLWDLYTDPGLLASAAGGLLTGDERALLRRDVGKAWCVADVPLLDEAAELLGVDDSAARAREEARRRENARFARQVLRANDLLVEEGDGDAVSAAALLSDDELARRHAETDRRSFAERAAEDRTWVYGHVIVDEAQELSAMTWRALFRRCPSGSMTVVGDVHQASGPTAVEHWEAALAPHTSARVRRAELTVSYRTPREIMDAAVPVLRALDPAARAPLCARSTGAVPTRVVASAGGLADAVAAVVQRARRGGDRAGVIAPADRVAELAAALGTRPGAVDLRADVVVLSPAEAKGLEFDAVVVAEPAGILAAERGLNDLYVALTRPTSALTVVHTGSPPEVLAHLPAAPARQSTPPPPAPQSPPHSPPPPARQSPASRP